MDCVVLRFMHVIAAVGFLGFWMLFTAIWWWFGERIQFTRPFTEFLVQWYVWWMEWSQSHRFAAIWWIDMQFRCVFLDFFEVAARKHGFCRCFEQIESERVFGRICCSISRCFGWKQQKTCGGKACTCQVTTRYLCPGVVWKGTEWALSWPTLCFVFWGFVETLDPSLQYLIQGSLAQAQVSIWCDTFTFWGFTCWTLPGVLRFTKPRITEWNLSVGCFTRFTFYRNAFA